MRLGAELAHERGHQIDMVVEVEAAIEQRHVARVDPVGDVDIVIGQQGLDRAAQQRGEMAGQRRHHQHARLLDGGVLAEMQQRAEGVAQQRHFADGDRAIAHHGAADAEIRPLVPHARARHHLAGSSSAADYRMMAKGGPGLGEQALKGVGEPPYRGDDIAMRLIGLIEHCRQSLWFRA